MYFGYWWRRDPARAGRRVWILGAFLFIASLTLRAAGGWGNIRLPRDNSWIEFFNNVKYPPSFVFSAMSLGLGLLILALFLRLPHSLRSPLIVFGQTPLFFYIAHFYLLALFAFAFFPQPASLEGAWVITLAALAALYPVCAWYQTFKLTKPKDSLWRLF